MNCFSLGSLWEGLIFECYFLNVVIKIKIFFVYIWVKLVNWFKLYVLMIVFFIGFSVYNVVMLFI